VSRTTGGWSELSSTSAAVVGLLGFSFGFAFRQEIAWFLQDIAWVRIPGGAELHSRQTPEKEKKEDALPAEKGAVTLGPEEQRMLREHFQKLQQDLAESSQQAELTAQEREEISEALESVSQMLAAEQQKTIFWWYQYLNLFLVLGTKFVLKWFAGLQIAPTKDLFHEYWKTYIPDAKERETILSVLLFHQLIEANGQQFWITEAGQSFLQFLDQQGLWPPPAPAGGG